MKDDTERVIIPGSSLHSLGEGRYYVNGGWSRGPSAIDSKVSVFVDVKAYLSSGSSYYIIDVTDKATGLIYRDVYNNSSWLGWTLLGGHTIIQFDYSYSITANNIGTLVIPVTPPSGYILSAIKYMSSGSQQVVITGCTMGTSDITLYIKNLSAGTVNTKSYGKILCLPSNTYFTS